MDQKKKELLKEFSLNPGVSEQVLATAEKYLTTSFPDDYRDFMQFSDGGEGFIGQEYLILWKVEELEQFNREYEVEKYAPGLLLFGSSGGGEGFAFDTRNSPYKIVQVPFVGMDLENSNYIAENFFSLLERMQCSDGTLL